MSSTEEPSQASRLEGVAEAGMGADDSEHTARLANAEKTSSARETPSNSSEAEIQEPKKEDAPEEPQRSKLKITLIMLSLCIAVFLAALDTTIITTAVPTISAVYNASEADYTWIGSAYLLAAAASTPSWGKFSDIWGRKPTILVANVVFFVGSLIAAVSTSIKMLLAGRVIQGIGGGGLIILANICISDLFSMRWVPSARVSSLTTWNSTESKAENVVNTSDSSEWFGELQARWDPFLVVSSRKRSPGGGVSTSTVSATSSV